MADTEQNTENAVVVCATRRPGRNKDQVRWLRSDLREVMTPSGPSESVVQISIILSNVLAEVNQITLLLTAFGDGHAISRFRTRTCWMYGKGRCWPSRRTQERPTPPSRFSSCASRSTACATSEKRNSFVDDVVAVEVAMTVLLLLPWCRCLCHLLVCYP